MFDVTSHPDQTVNLIFAENTTHTEVGHSLAMNVNIKTD